MQDPHRGRQRVASAQLYLLALGTPHVAPPAAVRWLTSPLPPPSRLAAYDGDGKLRGQLGASSPDLLSTLPLPLYVLWAHTLIAAARLGHWAVARRAAGVLLPRFVAQVGELWSRACGGPFCLPQGPQPGVPAEKCTHASCTGPQLGALVRNQNNVCSDTPGHVSKGPCSHITSPQ